jgi:hypothetical protein
MDAAGLLALKKLREVSVPFEMGDGAHAVFHIRALSRTRYRELLDDHPPRPDTADRDWNEDTFPPSLLAESVTKIVYEKGDESDEIAGLTLEEATEMWSEWEAGLTQVANACWNINEQAVGVGFTWPGFEKILASGLKSVIALNGESATESS